MVKFICPKCLNPLIEQQENLVCEGCSAKYPIKDGIPFFTSGEYYFPDISEADMDELLAISEQQGWRVGLHDFLRDKDPSAYKIVGDESRADWKFIFPLCQDSVVLDFGCGFGGLSVALSRLAGEVIAMDCSLKRLKFLNIRKKQDNMSNIIPVCGGDAMRLPFTDKYFDLIVLNGVLEWLGIFHVESDPRQVQLAKLKDLYRLLKDNGSIYIGIENRFSYLSFLGARDHSGLRFTSLLPRRIADLYCKAIKGERYRTYTYSLFGYKKLLNEAGFSRVSIYATIPTYRDVYFLFDINDKMMMDYFLKYLFNYTTIKRKIAVLLARIFSKIGLLRLFIPEYGIVATR